MPALEFIKISGTPFEAGQALGRFGFGAVQRHLLQTAAWHNVMQRRGSPLALAMAEHVRQRFPRIWQELLGLAEGLGVPFEQAFLWNCRGDLATHETLTHDGCTTVLQPGREHRRISHNEDGDPGFAGHCAIAECRIEGSPGFTSFVYPGSLPGHTFAVTDAGLAVTVNNLRPRHVDAGVPRMVLTRAVLDAPDLDIAVATLRDTPRAGAFHLTLGHRASPDLLSVEFNARHCSVQALTQPSLHANHAIHPSMRDDPQVVTDSSRDRQRRGDLLLDQAREAGHAPDPLAVLADTSATDDTGAAALPIYRTDPLDPDGENTLATADIAIKASHIEWDIYEQPGTPPRYRLIDGYRQAQDAPHRCPSSGQPGRSTGA
ncbi:C45 family autoproteolytic acyltransferase/hydolase [Paraburkholderia oxyphila]|uniref:C45 family autoproteolytic acyltransferase/hydolase n=1 Tax=Paraburkholderia oxyphila TaxID=614212 RepID=UPI00048A283D|nr:C45 family peptidase [Paraburkholderia oxyphila]